MVYGGGIFILPIRFKHATENSALMGETIRYFSPENIYEGGSVFEHCNKCERRAKVAKGIPCGLFQVLLPGVIGM